MANTTEYRVKLTGDTSDFIKKIDGAGNALKNLKKLGDEISFGVNFQDQEGVAKFIASIKDDMPDLVLKIRYDIAMDELEKVRNEADQLFKLEDVFDFNKLGLSPDDYKAKVREFIDGIVKEINDMAKNADVDEGALKQRVQELFDINKFFGNSGYSRKDKVVNGKTIKGLESLLPDDLKTLIGVKPSAIKARTRDQLYSLQTGLNKGIKALEADAKKRGMNLSTQYDFDYEGKIIKKRKSSKSKSSDEAESLKETKEAADEAAESLNNVVNIDIGGLEDLIKNINVLIEALKSLVGVESELSSNGILENVLSGAIGSGIGTKAGLKKYLKENLPADLSENGDLIDAVINTSGIHRTKVGGKQSYVTRNDYKEWASDVISAMDQAGKSVDGFAEKKEVLGKLDLSKLLGFNVDAVNKFSTELTKIIDAFNSKDGVENILNAANAISELSEVIQKASGVMSSSALNEEFDKIFERANVIDKDAPLSDLEGIVEQYSSYLSMGGQKTLEDLFPDESIRNKVASVAEAMGLIVDAEKAVINGSGGVTNILEQLTTSINDLLTAFKNVNGDAALSLNDLFASIKKQAEDTGLNRKQKFTGEYADMADALRKRYELYQSRGGTEVLPYKGLNNYWSSLDQEKKSAIGADAEAKSLEGVATAAEKAATSKEAFNAANTKLGEGAEASQKQLDAEHEGLKQLDGSELGADKAKELSEHLQSAYDSLSRLIGLLSGSDPFAELAAAWQEGDKITEKSRKNEGMFERTAYYGTDGKFHGAYAYGGRDSSDGFRYTTLPEGVKPVTSIHSHGSDHIAALSGTDIIAWAYDVADDGVKDALVMAIDDVEHFEAESFFREASKRSVNGKSVNFKDPEIQAALVSNAEGMIEYIKTSPLMMLDSLAEEYGKVSMDDFASKIKASVSETIGEGYQFDPSKFIESFKNNIYNGYSDLMTAIDDALSTSITDKASGELISKSIAQQVTGYQSALAADESDKLMGVFDENDSLVKDVISRYTAMLGLSTWVEDPRLLETFQYKKLTPGIFDGSFSKYVEDGKAVDLGVRDLFEKYLHYYTQEEFQKGGILGGKQGGIGDLLKLFSGPPDTSGLTDAFNSIKNLVKSLGSEDGISKLSALKESIGGLIEVLNTPVTADSFIKELSSLAATGGSLKDLATVLKSSKTDIDKAKKALTSQDAGGASVKSAADIALEERQERARIAESLSKTSMDAELKRAEETRRARAKIAEDERREAEKEAARQAREQERAEAAALKERQRRAAEAEKAAAKAREAEVKQAEKVRKAAEAQAKKEEEARANEAYRQAGVDATAIRKGLGKTRNENDDKLYGYRIETFVDNIRNASAAGFEELPKSARAAVDETMSIFNSSVDVYKQMKDILTANDNAKTKFLSDEDQERAKKLLETIKSISDIVQSEGFDFKKLFSFSDDEIRSFIGTIDKATNFANKKQLASTVDVSKVYERAQSLFASSNNANVRQQLSGITEELSKALNSGEDLDKTFANIPKDRLEEIKAILSQVSGEMKRAGDVGRKTFSQNLASQITSQGASLVAQYTSIRYMWRYLKQAAQTTVQVDSAITELRKVSGESNTRLQESFKASAATAQELGATISDVINSTSDWSRLGYSIDQAEDLARVTELFRTVGDNMTQETSSKYLISTLKGFQLDAEQAEGVVDKFNEVANNYAIDTAGIGDALQRSASAFNTAHTSLDKSIALITATNTVLQNPYQVGTLWNTLSARIRGASTELADLGEEEDEFTQTTSKLRNLVKELTGFDIMENENEYKDLYDMMIGIGEQWGKLTDIQRASLGEALAGKRNTKGLYAVMDNLDVLKNAYQTSTESAGSAAREQEAYAQSVQYSIDRFKASIQELSVSFMSSDFLKDWVERGNSFIQFITTLTDKLGSLGSIVTAFAGIDLVKTLLTGGSRGILGNLMTSIAKTMTGGTEIKGIGELMSVLFTSNGAKSVAEKAAIAAGKDVATAYSTSLKVALAGSAPMLIASGIAIAGMVGLAIYSSIKRHNEKLIQDAKSAAEKWNTDQSSLDKQYKQVDELRTKLDEDETLSDNERLNIKQQIYDIQKQITEQYGEQASSIDLVNGKLETQRDILDNISAQKAKEILAENEEEFRAVEDRLTQRRFTAGIQIKDAANDPVARDIEEALKPLDLKYAEILRDIYSGDFSVHWNDANALEVTEETKIITMALQDLREEYKKTGRSAKDIKELDDAIKELQVSTESSRNDAKELSPTLEYMLGLRFDAAGGQKYTRAVKESMDAVDDAIISGDYDAMNQAVSNYEGALSELRKFADGIEGFDTDGFVQSLTSGFNQIGVQAAQFKKQLQDAAATSDKSDYEFMSAAQDRVAAAKEAYEYEKSEFEKIGSPYKEDRTVFGNVDLGTDRGLIEWNDANIERYRSALESWGRTDSEYSEIFNSQGEEAAEAWIDGYVESFKGGYSTVFGGAEEFLYGSEEKPIEIAYTPIIKTGNRLSMLSADEITAHIQNLVDQSTDENGELDIGKLMELDAKGIETNGKFIRNVIADIGDTAIATAEAMHYLGAEGTVPKAAQTFKAAKEEYDTASEKFNKYREEHADEYYLQDQMDTLKEYALDTVDFEQMMDSSYIDFAHGTGEAEVALQRIARQFGVAFNGTPEDTAKIDALKQVLIELGLVTTTTVDHIAEYDTAFKSFREGIMKAYSSIDSVNATLVNAVSGKGLTIEYDAETGKLAGDIGAIYDAFKDLDGFHPADIFKSTANGVKLNYQQLRKLQQQQEKITRKKFLAEQKRLTEQLMIAERNRANAMGDSDAVKGYQEEIDTIRQQLTELGYLQSAYDGATSAYQKWLAAQSAGEEGDVYDNMRENMVKRADELWKEGLTGTEEFRAIAQLISGEDLTTANIDQVEAAYKQLDATIGDTGIKLRDFFAEGGTGVKNFLKAMVDLNYATEENGIVSFKYIDTEELAKSMGTSVDIVEAALHKLKDYGFDITWFDESQLKQLKELDKTAEGVMDHIEKSGVKHAGVLSDSIFDLDSLDTVEELESAAKSIEDILAEPAQFNINDDQAQALKELLDIIIEKRNIIETPTGIDVTTVDQFVQYEEALAGVREEAAKIKGVFNKSGKQLEFSKSSRDTIEMIAKLPKDIQIALGIEPTTDANAILQQLYGNSTPTVHVSREERETTYSEEHIQTNKTENEETFTYHVNGLTELQVANVALAAFNEGLPPEEIATSIVCEAYGIEDVEELEDAEERAAVDRDVKVVADAIGKKDVTALANAINSVKDKAVNFSITTTGASTFLEAWNEWKKVVPNATKKNYIDIITRRGEDVYFNPNRVNGTAHAIGSAYAGGKWGLNSNQKALINEVGPEIVVRGSNWFIPNNGRPTMNYPLKRGDIIFNAKQSEELLKNGYVANGYAHAKGTMSGVAFGGASGIGKLDRLDGNTSNNTSSSNNNSNKTKSSNNNSDRSSTKAAEEAAENIKDWIEVLLDRISRALENFKSMAEYWTSYVDQNRELNNAIAQARSNIVDNQRAYARYIQQANSVGLPESYAKKVRDGEINIEEIKDEKLQEKIEKYTEWYLQMPTRSVMAA